MKLLEDQIELALKREQLLKPDVEGNVDVWHWDAKTGLPVRQKLPAEQAAAAMAAQLSGDLISIAPDDAHAKQLFVISTLESATYRAGWDRPLPQGAGSDFERVSKLGAHDD